MPARRYKVTPRLPDGRARYIATFRDHAGARRNRGLGTASQAEAELICAALVRLHLGGWPAHAAPEDLPRKAVELFYNEDVGFEACADPAELPDEAMPPMDAAAGNYVAGLRHEVAELRAAHEAQAEQLRAARAELAALRTSMLGRAAEAAERCPAIAEARDLFAEHLAGTVTPKSASEYLAVLDRFLGGAGAGAPTPAHISAEALGAHLDAYTRGAAKPAVRRRKERIKLGRFINWAAKTWGFPSPMPSVPGPKSGAVARERGEIHWHSMAEVDAVLEGLAGDSYWRAVVGTLAFAGLQLAELAWLRSSDLQPRSAGGLQLWITPSEGHQLKTAQRRRAVGVHPRLAELLEAHAAGDRWLFAMPEHIRRRPREGDRDRWRVDTLGKHLGERLPDGMDARSLRRTFGSLLLRAGKTAEQVAAAMGNSPAVVHAHYARIIGSEVEVDF
jgi:integrase